MKPGRFSTEIYSSSRTGLLCTLPIQWEGDPFPSPPSIPYSRLVFTGTHLPCSSVECHHCLVPVCLPGNVDRHPATAEERGRATPPATSYLQLCPVCHWRAFVLLLAACPRRLVKAVVSARRPARDAS